MVKRGGLGEKWGKMVKWGETGSSLDKYEIKWCRLRHEDELSVAVKAIGSDYFSKMWF